MLDRGEEDGDLERWNGHLYIDTSRLFQKTNKVTQSFYGYLQEDEGRE